ncbi:MAG TPA: ElyC/SanA/YdcF family protein [Flavobacteriales bacterium]|jgi:SanA protein|nr:ElyC/SanA/YdcF family protein [Flavobacteriales bacterium]
MRWWRWALRLGLGAAVLLFVAQWAIRAHVGFVSDGHVLRVDEHVPPKFTGIVLGCRVREGDVSRCLEERLARALALYQAGTVQRLLLSGDHGRRGYDEVNTMKAWLVERGVPLQHIFLDHAGFDTYDTMVRARGIFQVKDAVVISQAFHLPRAVYLARSLGIDAVGAVADPEQGSSCKGSAVREPVACLKAWMNVTFASDPKFGGVPIPITGSPEASFDQPADDAVLRSEE